MSTTPVALAAYGCARRGDQACPRWAAEHELFGHYLLTVVLFAMALLLALNVNELGDVFRIVGGTAGARACAFDTSDDCNHHKHA